MKRARSISSSDLQVQVRKWQKVKKNNNNNNNIIMPQSRQMTEVKFIDNTVFTPPPANANSTIIPINALGQGQDFNQRIGRKITMKSIQIRYQMNQILAPAGIQLSTRVLIVYDRQPTGALPAVQDILTTQLTCNGYVNLNNRQRFWILMDKIHCMDTAGPKSIMEKRFIRLGRKGVDATYNSVLGTIADISSGALYVIVQNGTPVLGNDMGLLMSTRVKYTDD